MYIICRVRDMTESKRNEEADMAVFTSSAFALRRKMIVEALKKCGAVNEKTAKTLADAGVENPEQFMGSVEMMIASGVIHKTKDGRYYAD